MSYDTDRNFLKETLKVLTNNGKNISDVLWCGTRKVWFSWDHFVEIANFEYYSGFGSQEIATNLLIVGKDWWLEREEYDGSEWWSFKSHPQKPEKQFNPKMFRSSVGSSPLEELNEIENK